MKYLIFVSIVLLFGLTFVSAIEEMDSMGREEFIFMTGSAIAELDSLEGVDTCLVDTDCISERDKCVEGICESKSIFHKFADWVSSIFNKE